VTRGEALDLLWEYMALGGELASAGSAAERERVRLTKNAVLDRILDAMAGEEPTDPTGNAP
jgi:hypothetical protein